MMVQDGEHRLTLVPGLISWPLVMCLVSYGPDK